MTSNKGGRMKPQVIVGPDAWPRWYYAGRHEAAYGLTQTGYLRRLYSTLRYLTGWRLPD